MAQFSEKYPDIILDIKSGTHEEVYNLLRLGCVDLVLNDQRRVFSDEYVNLLLSEMNCCIEISKRDLLSEKQSVNADELRNTSCILVSTKNQFENDQTHYHEIYGIDGEFLFAENLEEARLMVVSGKGYVPVEGGSLPHRFSKDIARVPLSRHGKPIKTKYCAFWKTDNTKKCIKDFADILKEQFGQSDD